MKDVKLPSGATLSVMPAPFADSKALYQAVLKETKAIPLSMQMEKASLLKDLFCAGFSSKEIEACLWECFKRCLYNGVKIIPDTFEPVEAREDYMKVCVEVAKENILPFVKSLYAEYQAISEMTESVQA